MNSLCLTRSLFGRELNAQMLVSAWAQEISENDGVVLQRFKKLFVFFVLI